MGMFDDIIPGLGGGPASVGPAPTTEAQPADLKSEWDSFLQNPVNRNGLLGAGLQLMMGSWGSPLAASVGAGIESMAGTEKVLHDQDVQERAFNTGRSDVAADESFRRDELAARERMNNADNQTRTSIASTKTGRSPNVVSAYNTAYRQKMQAYAIPLMSGEITQEDAEAAALAAAERAAQSAESVVSNNGSNGVPGGPVQAGSGGNGPAGTQGAANNSAASGPPTASPNKGPSYKDISTRYGQDVVDQMLQNPERRAQFEAKWGKVEGIPAAKGQLPKNPAFKGTAAGTKESPFASRDQAKAGQWYKTKDGKKKRKGLFESMEEEG